MNSKSIISLLRRRFSSEDVKSLRHYLELYLLEDKAEYRNELLSRFSASESFHLHLRNEIKIPRLNTKITFVELKDVYDLHHEVLIVDEILPFYNQLLERTSKEQIARLENIIFVGISRLSNSIFENQNSFLTSVDRQLSYIRKFEEQPELVTLYRTFLRDQQVTYFSFIKTLTSEFKVSLQLEFNNEYLMLKEAEYPSLDQIEIKEIDMLIDLVFDMKEGMVKMNKRINKMKEYIDSKINII